MCSWFLAYAHVQTMGGAGRLRLCALLHPLFVIPSHFVSLDFQKVRKTPLFFLLLFPSFPFSSSFFLFFLFFLLFFLFFLLFSFFLFSPPPLSVCYAPARIWLIKFQTVKIISTRYSIKPEEHWYLTKL